MNDDLDAQFDRKVRELLKQVDDSQKKNIWKKTLRQSANVLKNDIKAEEIFERSLQKLQIKAFLNETVLLKLSINHMCGKLIKES